MPNTSLDDLDFVVNSSLKTKLDGATSSSLHSKMSCPIRHGKIDKWDDIEHLWQHSIYSKLRCQPENHNFLLTEPPLSSTPEQREQIAEIMFETFNVPGLYIAVDSVLAIIASFTNQGVHNRELSGVVVDSGDGVTRIVPVAEGHVLSHCIEQVEVGGRHVTAYVQDIMRQRKEPIPPDLAIEVARVVKEEYAYTCPNVDNEMAKFDGNPDKYITRYEHAYKPTGRSFSCNIGHERFLAPEVILTPEVRKQRITKQLYEYYTILFMVYCVPPFILRFLTPTSNPSYSRLLTILSRAAP